MKLGTVIRRHCKTVILWLLTVSLALFAVDFIMSHLAHQLSTTTADVKVSPVASECATSTTSPEETDQSVRKLLIAAYFRSGSTLISEMATLDNDTFYIFEPYRDLYAAWYSTPAYNEVTYTPAGKRQLPKGERERLVQSLIDMFECRFNRLPVHFYANIFFLMLKHHSWNDFQLCAVKANITLEKWRQCYAITENMCPSSIFLTSAQAQLCHTVTQLAQNSYRSRNGDKYAKYNYSDDVISTFASYRKCVNDVIADMGHCHLLLEERCKAAKTRAIKEIRLDMETITMVTRRYPNLHVLHLVRHPGALIHSRFLFPFVSQFESVANTTVCTRLRNDVKGQSKGQNELNTIGWHTSPGHHYMRLRYEDMVTSLPQTASAIYRFMGKQAPPNMLAWVQSRSTSKDDFRALSTVKKNPLKHINNWMRSKMANTIVSKLTEDTHCADVMTALNYSVHVS